DLAGEVGIALVDDRLDHLAHGRVHRTRHVEGTSKTRGADAVGMHADLVQAAGEVRDHAEDADRTGDGGLVGVDAVGVHADPVTTGSRHVAHRHHHRLAGGLERVHFAADLLGGEYFTARRIHTQHHGLHVVIVAG